MPDLKKLFARGVYIYAADQTLTHFSGCLVEGLLALGIPVKTNATTLTSRPVSMPLARFDLNSIKSDPLTGFACYLVDISTNNTFIPFEGVDPAPVGYITTSDISTFCEVPSPHLLFAAHDSIAAVKPGVRIPIAFGLVDRLAKNSAGESPTEDREQIAVDTFRPTLQQGVRALLELAFIPSLEKRMPVNRVNLPPREYYGALMNSALCLAYGGEFYSPIMKNDWFKQNQPDLYAHHSFAHLDPAAVLRWDSWRFWEALAAGCVVVHLDFEAYGFNLPVMPEAWKHYIPIDLANPSASADEIWTRRSEWPAIAKAGQAWAFEHYTPTPTAERILNAMAGVLP
ncbi:MAG: hypothetical protein GKS03_13720 [Alphaproteobacteria bacterium]|nr:hypothetical protein [Alphaproteobacteria bacterium]